MKLRYQMRGLGIGVIVTALLMGVATGEKIPLSDAEIRAKALELGMVESDSLRLTDLQNVQPPSEPSGMQPSGEETLPSDSGDGPEDTREPGTAPEGEETPDSGDGMEDARESGDAPEGEETPDSGDVPEEAREPGADQEGEPVIIVIEVGLDSYSISKMFEEAGLVEDASVFDQYIYSLGHSRYIQAGTYEISPGTDMEEIAKIITGNR